MRLSRLLVRPRAWWFNKAPLSVTLVLLLIDGGSLDMRAVAALALVVLTVCAVGNFGYALNDLFDVDEDVRAARANAALAIGRNHVAWIIVASAIAALLLAAAAAGWIGAGLTLLELALPAAYSVPPLRIKERKWLGVAADALAAHVYPAALALLAVSHLGAAHPGTLTIACVLTWALAVGVRGILSHQLHTAERDRQGGLETVVHALGRRPLERLVIFGLVPLELAAFAGAVATCRSGPVLWAFGGLYLALEAFRAMDARFVVKALRPEGQRYIPLVEEAFYKAWGPLVIALDAARADLRFLLLIPAYALLFGNHMRQEGDRLRAIGQAVTTRQRSS